VQAIIRELRGEKIDIVEWSEDPVQFVMNGLSPAKVQRVTIVDDKEKVMEVVVEDKQLSLAIGKKGQNVRLAAKLTGWRIDIKSEEEKRKEVEAQLGAFDVPATSEVEVLAPSDVEVPAEEGEPPVDAAGDTLAQDAAETVQTTDEVVETSDERAVQTPAEETEAEPAAPQTDESR